MSSACGQSSPGCLRQACDIRLLVRRAQDEKAAPRPRNAAVTLRAQPETWWAAWVFTGHPSEEDIIGRMESGGGGTRAPARGAKHGALGVGAGAPARRGHQAGGGRALAVRALQRPAVALGAVPAQRGARAGGPGHV